MAGEWTLMRADEFCASVRDGTHDSPKEAIYGRPLVTSRHITSGRLDLNSAYLISQEDFDAINRRSKVDRWDVLLSMIGTVGEPCLIKEELHFAIKNIGLFKSKGETEGKWLYYYRAVQMHNRPSASRPVARRSSTYRWGRCENYRFPYRGTHMRCAPLLVSSAHSTTKLN
jgi:hypothetical protein